jgi:cytoskeletal protein CcmA (bactofilin family)
MNLREPAYCHIFSRRRPSHQTSFSYDALVPSSRGRSSTLTIPTNDRIQAPDLDASEGVTSIGRTISVRGEVRSGEYLIIEGRVDGRIMVPNHGLAIGKHGNVSSEVMAKTVTVLGTVRGNLTATERVELLPSGQVEGRIVTASLIMDEGCYFKGVVRPTLRDTVLAVNRYRLKQAINDT